MFFAWMCLWIGAIGGVPLVLGWLTGNPLPGFLLGYASASGICLSVYFLGLGRGYRIGDFTLIYPLGRALPILLLVGFDLWRGRGIDLPGYFGILAVAAGCVLLVGNGRSPSAGKAGPIAAAWVLMIAMGTVGYTAIDKLAMERVVTGNWMVAFQYGCLQFAFAFPLLWIALRRLNGNAAGVRNGTPAAVVLIVAGTNLLSYVLILVVYQIVAHASYVLALRQFSIVIGVVLGALLFREPAPRARVPAAVIITAGVLLIAFAMAQ